MAYSSIDYIELKLGDKLKQLEQKLKDKINGRNDYNSFLGFLTNSFTEDNQIDIFGYCTPTGTKFVLLMEREYGSQDFMDQNVQIQEIMREIRELYTQDLLNPFHKHGDKLSQNFDLRVHEFIKKYDIS